MADTSIAKFILIFIYLNEAFKGSLRFRISHTIWFADCLQCHLKTQNIDSGARVSNKCYSNNQRNNTETKFTVSIHTPFLWNFEVQYFLLGINAHGHLIWRFGVFHFICIWFLVFCMIWVYVGFSRRFDVPDDKWIKAIFCS